MIRTRMMAVIAATTGALLLSACGGSTDDGAAAEKPQQSAAAASDGKNFEFLAGTAKQNGADLRTGDGAPDAAPQVAAKSKRPVVRQWVQPTAKQHPELGEIVVNGNGFTLYRFDKDTASPSKSNCFNACAANWPPYLIAPGGKVHFKIDPSQVGFIPRDGAFQVTIGGWPVYLFSGDTKAGQTNGQGKDNGTWAAVTPEGEKAGGGAVAPSEPPAETIGGENPAVQPATSGVFFDTPNFGEPAEGITGPGCKPVRFPGSVSILGSAKVWAGDNCTGKSATITSSVTDLNSLGLGTIKSIRFAG
ncbi:hypothetical protein [Streptomyces capillispiralis]|uniref:Secreted repeat protein with Y-X4-D motif n=1 Tax=Streptomyces capillispiralis TaxID=68182 RepID=A0A561SGZ9_9ACTN|nr:hypothetical protein [Streptomyces capillispiralis]TWF74113.1 secreted repeat protein with Y-X4-D motif [Streptomyces capillispiralis]